MQKVETGIPDLIVFYPSVFEDERGYFMESFNEKVWKEMGVNRPFVQDNQSKSSYGVLRGLHYQHPPYAQAKLVRVLSGKVLDVVVDLRVGSPTYGKSYSIELSAENKAQMYVPRGFAHGYVVLSETAEFFYKCDNYYAKEHEGGLKFDDPQLKLDWVIGHEEAILSGKDKELPDFENIVNKFVYGKV